MRRGRRRGAGGTDPEAGALGPEVSGAEAGTRWREGAEATTGMAGPGARCRRAGACARRGRSQPWPAGTRAVEAEQPDGRGREAQQGRVEPGTEPATGRAGRGAVGDGRRRAGRVEAEHPAGELVRSRRSNTGPARAGGASGAGRSRMHD